MEDLEKIQQLAHEYNDDGLVWQCLTDPLSMGQVGCTFVLDQFYAIPSNNDDLQPKGDVVKFTADSVMSYWHAALVLRELADDYCDQYNCIKRPIIFIEGVTRNQKTIRFSWGT